jgi:hypothetical protein
MPSGTQIHGFDYLDIDGPVYHPSGPALAPVFDPAQVNMGTPVGSFHYWLEYSFFYYSIGGVSGVKDRLIPFRF